jgi:hypothetical protein
MDTLIDRHGPALGVPALLRLLSQAAVAERLRPVRGPLPRIAGAVFAQSVIPLTTPYEPPHIRIYTTPDNRNGG